jgi:F-type H+-transporting ATPase subunit delta
MASLTSRYARAFADVVLARGLDSGRVRGELRDLLALLQPGPELRRVWESPAIAFQQKLGLLDAVISRAELSRPVRNFAAVLIEHRRIGQLGQIFRQFEQELNRRLGIAEAEVLSARELAPEERRALEARIERMTGRKVSARYSTEAALLGGAIVRLGSTIYDGSVRGQLNRIREQLSTG